jgi:DNA-binding transcriptional ArsR family regulator
MDTRALESPTRKLRSNSARIYRSYPIRIQILAMLAASAAQVCVCDLEAALPVKQPTVSHHLKLLRDAGLMDCERRGLWAYYFVDRPALAALRADHRAARLAGLTFLKPIPKLVNLER